VWDYGKTADCEWGTADWASSFRGHKFRVKLVGELRKTGKLR
jgi:hypothetical protein